MTVDKMNNCFIKDRPGDVSWLCSLSKSEMDMLINLKMFILHRAETIGHEELAEKFDLKVLRAIVFILMEYLKEQVKDSPLTQDTVKPAAFLDACNFLRCDHENVISFEHLSESIGIDPHRIAIRPQDEVVSTPEIVDSNLKKRKRKCFLVEKKRPKWMAKNS